MADSFLLQLAGAMVEAIGSEAVKEIASIWGVKEDLDELGETLSTIKGVLRNAEKRQQGGDGVVESWLERLERVVKDVDNLLDDVSYESLRKTTTPGKKVL